MNHTAKPRAKGKNSINFYTLFWLFMIGSLVGFIVEGVWAVIKTGHWEHHAATLWGPFCVIYGIGAVVVYIISYLFIKKGILFQFGIYAISGAAVEYFGSLFQEICFGSVSWNYGTHFLNIGGRVSLRMALVWGVLGIVFMYGLYPAINRVLLKLDGKGINVLACGLAVFMAVNLSVTSFAVVRWKERLDNIPAVNTMEKLIDDTYGNEKMGELFPNMDFSREAEELN